MKKTKNHTIVINTDKVLEPVGIPIVPNRSKDLKEFYFQMPGFGKKIKNSEEGYIYSATDQNRIRGAVISPTRLHVSLSVRLEELELLLKAARRQAKAFPKGCSFVHLNPNLSFMLESKKK